ncbi:MAG: hypothetical protein LBT79_07610 [Elusimicrobiota bacterium]|jgi:hypothetical protein|nr:hypothetical protein [Elusimicrobiota bacterium]
MRDTAVIMKEGIECLLERMGSFETEIFISNILKEPFNYTQWQKKYFERFSIEELNKMAVQQCQEHRFTKKGDKRAVSSN